MWKLHRYYLRELTINATITFVVVFAIVLISLVARGIQRAQGGGLLDAALITLFWALDAFPHLLTVAFLVAVVLTFARAAQDREMVALRSAGIGPRTPMMAALLLGGVLTLGDSVCMHYVLPEVHFQKYHIGAEVLRNLILNMRLTGDRIPILNTGIVLTFKERDAHQNFTDCTLFDPKGRLGAETPVLHVDRVSIPPLDIRSEDLAVQLTGITDPFGKLRLSDFSLRVPLRGFAEQGRRPDTDADMTSDQLLAEVLRGVHEAPTGAIYTLHRRTCYAIMPLLLAPIGFCIALLARDRGRALALTFALLPLLVFYVGDILSAKVLRATEWAPIGWLPAMLLLLLGGPFVWRTLRS